MTDAERERFDALLEEAIGALPARLRALLEEVPLIVEDRPSKEMAAQLAAEFGETDVEEFAATLCGLHTGTPLTERSVEAPWQGEALYPDHMHIFREGIVRTAGGWEPQGDETAEDVDDAVYDEIMTTVLHEIGHHFGLEEDDLRELGYD